MTIASRDQQRTRRVSVFLIAGLILLTILLSCCGEHPPKPEPVEYVLYYGNSANGDLYVFDADSLTIIDSIPNVGPAISLVTSPDGRWLYAEIGTRPEPPTLMKIDTRTKQVAGYLPDNVFSQLTLLDRGRLMLRGVSTCRRSVIDPNTLSLTRYLPDSICALRGPIDGTIAAALIGGTSRLRAVDVVSGEVGGEYIARSPSGAGLHVVDAIVSPDREIVLALAGTDATGTWFLIGDLETNETLLYHQLVHGQGQIAVNEDWTLAAVTDPSNAGYWDSYPTLDLFDVKERLHIKSFIAKTGGELEGFPRDVVFVPGTSLLIATSYHSPGSHSIHVIDVAQLSVIQIIHDPFPYAFSISTALAIGVRQ